jgi:O-antigen ligase
MTDTPGTATSSGGAYASGTHRNAQSRSVLFSGMVRALTAVASFEILFLLFVFAGHYKEMRELDWFPVDLTAFLFVVSGAAALFIGSMRLNLVSVLKDEGFILFLLFLLWTAISMLWSSFAEFNKLKLLHTSTLLSWSFLGCYLFVSRDLARTKTFIVGLVVLSVGLIAYWAYYRFVLGLVEEEEGGAFHVATYLTYAYHAQYLVAVVVALAIASRGPVSVLLSLLGLLAIWGVMLLIGGRGPLFFSILIFPLALGIVLVHRRASRYRLRFLTLPLGLLGVLGLLIVLSSLASPGLFEQLTEEATTLQRLQSYEQSGLNDTFSGRIHAQQFAVDRWFEAPIFGWGIGEFHLLYGVWRYPHNLFLEILMEEGVVGFALFGGLVTVGVARAWRLWPRDRANWVAMAVVLLLLGELASRATVQGFLPDERALFAFLGLVLGLGRGGAVRARSA